MQKLMERINDKDKIISTINRMVLQRLNVVLWQYDEDNSRILKNAQLLKFDEYNEEIFLTPKEEVFLLDLDKEVYCLYKERAMVLKAKISFCSKYKLALKYPKQLLIEESRLEPRINPTQDMKHLPFNFGVSKTNRFPYSTLLNDYSTGGLSFITNIASIAKFEVGDSISFKINIENQKYKAGEIVHISKILSTSLYQQYEYKIGVKFD